MRTQTTARANLYYADDDLRLRSIVDKAGLEGAVIEDGTDAEPGKITLQIGQARVELARMGAPDRTAHLEALHVYLSGSCALEDPELPARLKAAREAVTITIETERDRGSDVARFVSEVAARTGALVLKDDGTIEDAQGRTLAYPTGEVEEQEAEEAKAPPTGGLARPVGPPSADRTARRALVLVALAWRGRLEAAPRTPETRGELAVWRAWLTSQGLPVEMDDAEKTLIGAELGSLDDRQVIHCGWGVEGAAVLAWALGLLDLPPHDTKVSLDRLAKATGLFAAEPRAFFGTLLPRADLAAMTARLFGISWRLLRFEQTPGPFDFVGFSKGAWFGGFDLRGIPVAEGDLAIGGVPITKADKTAVAEATSIAVERFRAARWLEGRQADWSERVPMRAPGTPG